MKTYQAVCEKPLLEIFYDDVNNPREEQDNLGYFYTLEGKYISPDGKDTDIYRIMIETGQNASNEQNHILEMTRRINAETDEKVEAVYPVYRYEHGNVLYRRGSVTGFDYSNCGFYIITDKTHSNYGKHAKPIEALIDGELEEYTAWANGEVYGFRLYGQDGNEIDACGGFYDLESIKEYLPKEWKNENLNDYIKY